MLNPCTDCNLENSCENENTDKRHECTAFLEYEKHQAALLRHIKIELKGNVHDYDGELLDSFEEDGLDGMVLIGIAEGEKFTKAHVITRGLVDDEFANRLSQLVRDYYPHRT